MLRGVDPRERFGTSLRRIRTDVGLSQEQLALDAKTTAAEISRMESGLRDPQMTTILRIAEVLDTSLDDLVLGTGGR